MSNTLKVLLVATILIAIGVFGYWYATSNTSQPMSALQSSVPAGTVTSPLGAAETAISDKFLSLLLNMRTIKLDQNIFSDTAFTSLQDFSTTINPETNPGRSNPFAPIGTDPVATQGISVTTGQATGITKNSATFVGAVPIGTSVAKRYFEYGTTNAASLPNSTAGVPIDAPTGSFTFTITGLQANTTYYYRAAVVGNGGTIFGQTQSFQTLAQ